MYTIGDSISLDWKRRHRVTGDNGRNIWCKDKAWSASYDLFEGSVTIINPKDEDPLSCKNMADLTRYLHGGVSVKCCQLSVGLVFRVVDYDASYNENTACMITTGSHDEDKYMKLYETLDNNLFSSNIFNAYINLFF